MIKFWSVFAFILLCGSGLLVTSIIDSKANKMLQRVNLDSSIELVPNSKKIAIGHVYLVGDSRIEQWTNFPEELGLQITNMGVGGATSFETIELINASAFSSMPDKVVVQIGINDLKVINFFPEKAQIISENLMTNIAKLVSYFTQAGSKVYLTTTICPAMVIDPWRIFWQPETTEMVRKTNQKLREMNSSLVEIIDLEKALGCSPNLPKEYSRDLLHLNLKGYKAMNEVVANTFEKQL